MNWEGYENGCDLRKFPQDWLEVLHEMIKISIQDNWPSVRELNLGLPKYKTGELQHSTMTFDGLNRLCHHC
jgi:hypothetical protein